MAQFSPQSPQFSNNLLNEDDAETPNDDDIPFFPENLLSPKNLLVRPDRVNPRPPSIPPSRALTPVATPEANSPSSPSPSPSPDLDDTELAPPPERDSFPTIDAAINFAQDWAMRHGYALSKGNKTLSRDFCHTQRLNCTRSGRVQNNHKLVDSARARLNTGSAKTNCKMTLRVQLQDMKDPTCSTWCIQYPRVESHLQHNHSAVSEINNSHLRRKQRRTNQVISQLVLNCQKSGFRPQQTLLLFNQQHPEISITLTDIYNLRAQTRQSRIGGQTVVEATINDLQDQGFFVQ